MHLESSTSKKKKKKWFEVPAPPYLLTFPGKVDCCLRAGSLSTFLGQPVCPGFLFFLNIMFLLRGVFLE